MSPSTEALLERDGAVALVNSSPDHRIYLNLETQLCEVAPPGVFRIDGHLVRWVRTAVLVHVSPEVALQHLDDVLGNSSRLIRVTRRDGKLFIG